MEHLVITLPRGWRPATSPEQGVLLAALAPYAGSHDVVPSLRLTLEPVTTPTEEWHAECAEELPTRFSGFALDDEDTYEIGLHEARYRRFSHRRAGHDLVSEQWAWVVDGLGFLLSTTVAREDYLHYFEVFEAVADTFDPSRGDWPASA